jgi:galactokinase/mevalonate kinase-like predicted kinase
LRLRIETDIPAQAGLAGSSALLTAIVACLLHSRGEAWRAPHALAERVRQIEARDLQVACGYQDFYMAVWGGLNLMEFRDKQGLGADPDEPWATVESLTGYLRGVQIPLWLATTGGARFSGTVHANLRARWEAGDPSVADGMQRIGRLAREAKHALLEQDWTRLAHLMNENYAIIRDLGGSGESLDQLVTCALENGALGAKAGRRRRRRGHSDSADAYARKNAACCARTRRTGFPDCALRARSGNRLAAMCQ